MSPKEPLPILRPMRYLFPTRRSCHGISTPFLTHDITCACIPAAEGSARCGEHGKAVLTIVVIFQPDLNNEEFRLRLGVCRSFSVLLSIRMVF